MQTDIVDDIFTKIVTFPVKFCQMNLYRVRRAFSFQMFFFMARVFLTKVATRKLQKYHRHCCSNAKKEGKFLSNKNYKIAGFNMLSLTNTLVSLNLQLILIGVIGAFLLRNVTDMAYV